MCVTAVSSHFVSPSIVSSLSVRYHRTWYLPMYGSCWAWICESHLTFATPYHPGTIRRSGEPWWRVSGSPFIAQARNGSGDSALSRCRLRPYCCCTVYFCLRNRALPRRGRRRRRRSPAPTPSRRRARARRAAARRSSARCCTDPERVGGCPSTRSRRRARWLPMRSRSASESDWGVSTSPVTFRRNVAESTTGWP